MEQFTGKSRAAAQHATARLNIWEGAVRSSKTVSSLIAWCHFVRNSPNGNLLMVGKTERTLKRNIIDPLTEWFGNARCRLVAGKGELYLFGRRIYIAGATDERAQEKIRGLTLLGAYVDEITTVPESFFAMLLSRLSAVGARLYGTTNPDNPTHWLKKNFLDKSRIWLTRDGELRKLDSNDALDLARFTFQLADNPYLPAHYITALKREFSGLWYRRFILGEWVAAEGAIYDMWDPDRHVVDTLPDITRWISAGIDYGTTNPFDALILGLGVDDRLYLAAEYRYDSRARRRQKTDLEYSTDLTAWLTGIPHCGPVQPEWMCVDPSATSFITQLHRDNVRGVTQANNSVIDGIRTISTLLTANRLFVHKSCEGWLEECPAYSWDTAASGGGKDKPGKENDHAMDAGRYAIYTTLATWWQHLHLTTQPTAA